MGKGSVRRIAEEHYTPAAPSGQAWQVSEGPETHVPFDVAHEAKDAAIPGVSREDVERLIRRGRRAIGGPCPVREAGRLVHGKQIYRSPPIEPVPDGMRTGPAPDMQGSGIRQARSLPGRDDAPEPDFTGMARYHFSADVAPRCRLHAVSTYDDARDDVIAVSEVQAHASGLVGQAHQPVTEADVFRWHRSGEKTLEGYAMEGQQRRPHILPVPLPYGMGPDQPAVSPRAHLKRRRFISNFRQVNAQTLQQATRVTRDRDPGADLPELGVLLEDLHRYRLLQKARRERQATDTPADNSDVTRLSHIPAH